jgi:hypothetical protein
MGFKVSRRLSLDRSFAAYKVHDHRDDGKDKEQMDKKTAHVEEEKSAKPKHYQNNTQNEEHCGACFLPETSCRAGATITGGKRGNASDSLLHNRIDEANPWIALANKAFRRFVCNTLHK